jgi:hypothetical protein
MNKISLIIVALLLSYCSYSQEESKKYFYDLSFGSSFISNTTKIDNYFGNIYNDYKNSVIPTFGVGFGWGYKWFNKIASVIDVSANMGINSKTLKEGNIKD